MATTVLDIIKSSLRSINVLGLNEAPDAQMASDSLQALNFMLSNWSNDGLNVYSQEQQTFNVSSGTSQYAIGSGATWDGNRPLKINAAYISEGTTDYYLDEITEKEYNDISDKETTGIPRLFYYNQTFPNGTVTLYPEPDSAYTITLSNDVVFSDYSSTSATISMPPGYLYAIKYNLALELAAEFLELREMNPWLIEQARKGLTAIKKTNKQKTPVKTYDPILIRRKTFDIDRGY
jgi:hypothetical protein